MNSRQEIALYALGWLLLPVWLPVACICEALRRRRAHVSTNVQRGHHS